MHEPDETCKWDAELILNNLFRISEEKFRVSENERLSKNAQPFETFNIVIADAHISAIG